MKSIVNDILIIGAGISGCCAALEAATSGKNVILLSKNMLMYSHSVSARGGINIPIGEESAEAHIEDTLRSGSQLASKSSVKLLCEQSIGALEWLESLGVKFEREASGHYVKKRFGGCRIPRACFVKGKTGRSILSSLYRKLKEHPKVSILEQHHAIDLIKRENRVFGATVRHIRNGEFIQVLANHTVIATGGGLNMFEQTTNAVDTTGDGLAIAIRAGAALKDMEFVQFHPLGLGDTGIQLPEPVLSAGGKLVDENSQPFIEKYEPENKELAGRDKVSQAIVSELNCTSGGVFIDLRHIPQEKQFLLEEAKELAHTFLGLDLSRDLIPVKPSAHYLTGGIFCDISGQVLDINGSAVEGLFAVGEAANSGVHGANRIGGNSLLEVVVFGRVVGRHIGELTSANIPAIEEAKPKLPAPNCQVVEQASIIKRLKCSMSCNVGVLRNRKGLLEQTVILKELVEEYSGLGITDSSITYNQEITRYFELKNMLELSAAITVSALHREESRGSHYRQDFPLCNVKTPLNSLVGMQPDGAFVYRAQQNGG